MARASSLIVLLAVAALLNSLVGSVTAEKGGAGCTMNVQCGWPAGNVDSLREQAASLTGQCTDGECECHSIYGCDRCSVIELPNDGTLRTLIGTSTKIDLCGFSWGGGVCTKDTQCGNGLCIDNRCVCYKDWACDYCSLDLSQDILNGAKCGQYVSGRGVCSSDAECNSPFGVCRNGRCQCGSGYACQYCDRAVVNLLSGADTCPCDGITCSGHGQCHSGACICNDGYVGSECDFDPCEGKTCSGHGTCSRATGHCICDEGFGGDDCSTGGGTCDEDKHCGIFGDNKFGGECDENNECQCFPGYTCTDCAGLGEECGSAIGGGTCKTEEDCGVWPTGFGGQCVFSDTDKYWVTEGRCRCWPGLVCPNCDVRLQDFESGVKCPEPEGAASSTQPVLMLVVALVAAVVVMLA